MVAAPTSSSAAPAGADGSAVLASDGFDRTATGGWGAADSGGSWSLNGPASSFSVSGGAGRLALSRTGSGPGAQLTSVKNESSDVRAELSLSQTVNGGGAYLWLVGRGTLSNGYREKVHIDPRGRITVSLTRHVNNAEILISSAPLPAVTYTRGMSLSLRMQVEGTSPTSLRAKVWAKGAVEPSSWQVDATDGAPGTQGARGIGVSAYLSKSATNVPIVLTVDTISAQAIPVTEGNRGPSALISSSVSGLTASFDAARSSDPDGTLASYTWDFGDGTPTVLGVTSQHTYAKPGSYSVKLMVTDDDGATGSASTQVSITAGTPVTPPTSSPLPSTAAGTLDTNYAIPAGSLFVATNGSDSNIGTQAAPLGTLAAALRKAPAGRTIVVRGGVYRQGISDPGTGGYPNGTLWTSRLASNVTVQAYPHETVWFDGTDVAGGWVRDGNGWSAPWSTPTFCGSKYYSVAIKNQTATGPCSHVDVLMPGTATGSPQMVFKNGRQISEVDTLGEAKGDSFFYDQAKRRIHLGFDPSGLTIEAAKRAQALAIHDTTNLSIKGIGFRRYGSNEYTNATSGAVALNATRGLLIERSVITENAGGGLLSWQGVNLTVRSSYLSANGFTGMLADGSYRQRDQGKAAKDDLVLEYSRLDRNNLDGFGVNCSASCSSAGAKFSMMLSFTVRGNSFSHNAGGRASGFWCDMACEQGRIYGNAAIGNDRHGILYEISNSGMIASNVMAGNGFVSGGSGLMVSAANTRIYNNTIADNWNNVLLYDDPRPTGYGAGPNSANMAFVNNIVTGGDLNRPQVTLRGGTQSVAGNTLASAFVKAYDYNSYHRPTGSSRWWLNWEEKAFVNELYQDPSALTKARGFAAHDRHVQTAADPFFVNKAAGGYRLRSGVSEIGSGAPLPADIASVLGVKANPVNRGALWLPGSASSVQPSIAVP